jgi:hypothetical protein
MIDETHDTPSSFPFNKIEEIEQIIAEDEVDLWALRELCLSEGGLISGMSAFCSFFSRLLLEVRTVHESSSYAVDFGECVFVNTTVVYTFIPLFSPLLVHLFIYSSMLPILSYPF